MWVSLMAVLLVLSDAGNFTLSLVAVLDIGAYLTAYFFKFQFMTKLAKSNEQSTTLRYFVEEQMIASPLLLLVLAGEALDCSGQGLFGFRVDFTTFVPSAAVGLGFLV